MTPDNLEARLAGQPGSATVAAVVAALRADPDWSMTEVELEGHPVAFELVHHPTDTAYTLSRRAGSALRRREH